MDVSSAMNDKDKVFLMYMSMMAFMMHPGQQPRVVNEALCKSVLAAALLAVEVFEEVPWPL